MTFVYFPKQGLPTSIRSFDVGPSLFKEYADWLIQEKPAEVVWRAIRKSRSGRTMLVYFRREEEKGPPDTAG